MPAEPPRGKTIKNLLIVLAAISILAYSVHFFLLRNNVVSLASIGETRTQEKEYIKVNPNSIIGSDVAAIWHHPSHSDICVHLTEGARCPHPDFVGRLSGKSLAMLEWRLVASNLNGSSSTGNATVYCGSYKNAWIHPGIYYLEIIIIFCSNFGVLTANRTSNLTEWLEYNFTYDCMENPDGNRITSSSAFLSVEMGIKSSEGHWVSNNETEKSLHTRYQPQNCRRVKNSPSRCTVAMDNSHLEELTFRWKDQDEWTKKLLALKPYQVDLGLEIPNGPKVHIGAAVGGLETQVHGGARLNVNLSKRNKELDGPKVCLVGASHSGVLAHGFWLNNLGHHVIWSKVEHPSEVSTKFFQDYYQKRNCTKFVIALGQWAAGSPAWKRIGGPMTFGTFRNEMSNIVNNEKIFEIGKGDIRLILRNIHHNPIGDQIGKCNEDGRPTDWRSVTVVDGYNEVIKKVVAESNNSRVEYLDTQFITFPASRAKSR